MVTIRPATADDVVFLGAIESAGDAMFAGAGHPEFVGGATISRDDALAAIASSWLLVAETDRVVGFVQLGRCGDELRLQQISVHPEAGRQGSGRLLMDAAFAIARSEGWPTIVLDTQADIAWNMPWYQSLGFVVVEPEAWTSAMAETTRQQERAGLDWSTRVHMRRRLDLPDA